MPFKLKLIKNIKKHMQNYNKRSSDEDENSSRRPPQAYLPNRYG